MSVVAVTATDATTIRVVAAVSMRFAHIEKQHIASSEHLCLLTIMPYDYDEMLLFELVRLLEIRYKSTTIYE